MIVYSISMFCRDGGNTFTPERYRLELNSAHTFSCRARVCAGVGGVFSVGVSCVRVTC